MKVHVVLWEVPYEGSELMGLYLTEAEAKTADDFETTEEVSV